MKMKSSLLGLFLLLVLVLAACGGAATTPEAAMEKESNVVTEKSGSEDSMMNQDSEAMAKDDPGAMKDDSDATMDMDSDTMADDDTMDNMDARHTDDAMNTGDSAASSGSDMGMDEATMELPDWFKAELIDVNNGQAFSVADLQDKVILVETMAIWCSNCLRQQQEVKALHEELGMQDGLVTLVLDIDPNEDADNLRAYTAKHGFEWTYAIAPREVAREIGQLYGDQFLNPPSTPMLIIDRHGQVHLLPFGRKTAKDLQEALEPFLNEEM
jgi:hypothetical protein